MMYFYYSIETRHCTEQYKVIHWIRNCLCSPSLQRTRQKQSVAPEISATVIYSLSYYIHHILKEKGYRITHLHFITWILQSVNTRMCLLPGMFELATCDSASMRARFRFICKTSMTEGSSVKPKIRSYCFTESSKIHLSSTFSPREKGVLQLTVLNLKAERDW